MTELTFKSGDLRQITGRGLVAIVDKMDSWALPADLPKAGSVIEVDGKRYRLRGVEYATGMGGRITRGKVGLLLGELKPDGRVEE